MDNMVLDRRNFLSGSASAIAGCATLSMYPTQAHAWWPIIRFIFGKQIRRQVTRQSTKQAGRMVAPVMKQLIKPKRNLSFLTAASAATAGVWGVIGVVEIEKLWSEGKIQELLGREPDVVVDKHLHGNVPIEFLSTGQQEKTAFHASAMAMPLHELAYPETSVAMMNIGQGVLMPGHNLSLSKELPVNKMLASRYVVAPHIFNLGSKQIVTDDFGAGLEPKVIEVR